MDFTELFAEFDKQGFVIREEEAVKSFIRTHTIPIKEVRRVVEGLRKELPKTKCINAENHLFGSCFQCEKINGYNQALTDLLALLTNNQTEV